MRKLLLCVAALSVTIQAIAGEMDELLAQAHTGWKSTGKYRTKAMDSQYVEKDAKWGVEYWDSEKRSPWELKFEAGRVTLPENLPKSQTSSGGLVLSSPVEGVPSTQMLMYAMTESGRFYVYPTKAMKHQHSTFLAGEPVAAAGMIIIRDGKVAYIDNVSGHYLPNPLHLAQAIHALQLKGVPVEGLKVGIRRDARTFDQLTLGSRLHVVPNSAPAHPCSVLELLGR